MQVTHSDESVFTMHMGRPQATQVREELHQTFVTYAEPREKPLPNMAKLISLPDRYYLHPVKNESAYHTEKFGKLDNEIDIAVDRQEEVIGLALDLGTASLQRIVSQMKGLKFEVKEKRFNKDAAKLGGLKSYTEYISEYEKMKLSRQPYRGQYSLYKDTGKKKKKAMVPGGRGLRGKSDVGCDIPETGEKITVAPAAKQ